MVVMIAFTTMAIGLNMVVGYARPARPRLRRLLRRRRVHGRLVRLAAVRPGLDQLGAVGIPDGLPGIHISMWLVLPIAGLLTLLAGIAIGLPTLRLRGDYLAIVTLGFGEIVPQFVRNARQRLRLRPDARHRSGSRPIDSLGFGVIGAKLGLPESFRQSSERSQWYFWTAVVILLITVFCSVRLRDSRLGRAWIAIREDETAAARDGHPADADEDLGVRDRRILRRRRRRLLRQLQGRRVPGGLLLQHLGLPALHGHPRRHGQRLGRDPRRHDPRLPQRRGPRHDRLQDPAVGVPKLDEFDPTKYQFGIYGIIIVVMMLFRPTGLIPERRHKIEMEEGVHDTPFYDVQHEGTPHRPGSVR